MICRHPCAVAASAVVLFAVILISPSLSRAAVYSEIPDGELPSANPITLITFDFGLNTVSGTFGNLGFPTDYDSFAFTIPDGLFMSGGNVQVVDNVGNIASGTWDFRTGAVAGAGDLVEEIFALSPGNDVFGPAVSGTYHIGAVSFGFFEVGRADYTFSFFVIPEPTTLALVSFAPLMLIRRRR